VTRGPEVGVWESKLRGIRAQALVAPVDVRFDDVQAVVRASPSEFRRQRPGDAPGAASDVQNSIGAAQARHLLEDSQRVLADLAVVARADTEQEVVRRNRRFARLRLLAPERHGRQSIARAELLTFG